MKCAGFKSDTYVQSESGKDNDVLPKTLTSCESNLTLRGFDSHAGTHNAAKLMTDGRLWEYGFDACGYGRPGGYSEAYQLVKELYAEGDHYNIWRGSIWVGVTGVTSWNRSKKTVKMDRTMISPDYWGRGVNTTVKKILFTHLFSEGVERIEAVTTRDNSNSLRSLQKLGFKSREVWEEENPWTGEKRSVEKLSLSLPDWESHIPTDTVPIKLVLWNDR